MVLEKKMCYEMCCVNKWESLQKQEFLEDIVINVQKKYACVRD